MRRPKYYLYRTWSDNRFVYIARSQRRESIIEVEMKDDNFHFKFNFYMDGNFNFPERFVLCDIESTIFSIKDFALKDIIVNGENDLHKFYGEFSMKIQDSYLHNKNFFIHEIPFRVKIHYDTTILEQFNIENIDQAINDFNLINYNLKYYYTNYCDVEKLGFHHIINQWEYETAPDRLPINYFDWSTQKYTIHPTFYLIKNESFYKQNHPLYRLYETNVRSSYEMSDFFEMEAKLTYSIRGVVKTLDIKPHRIFNTIKQNLKTHIWGISVKTLYDFEKEELYVDNEGIEGIYFPVPTVAVLELKLKRDSITYVDTIPMNFTHDIFSNTNQIYRLSLKNHTEQTGYWNKLVG